MIASKQNGASIRANDVGRGSKKPLCRAWRSGMETSHLMLWLPNSGLGADSSSETVFHSSLSSNGGLPHVPYSCRRNGVSAPDCVPKLSLGTRTKNGGSIRANDSARSEEVTLPCLNGRSGVETSRLFMPLLTELSGLGDGSCYKHVAPNGALALQRQLLCSGSQTPVWELHLPRNSVSSFLSCLCPLPPRARDLGRTARPYTPSRSKEETKFQECSTFPN